MAILWIILAVMAVLISSLLTNWYASKKVASATTDTKIQAQSTDDGEHATAEMVLRAFLQEQGCTATERPDEPDSDRLWFDFVYQGGNFTANVSSKERIAYCCYNNFYQAPSCEADRLSRIANEYNNKMLMLKCITNFDEQDNLVYMSLSYETLNVDVKCIAYFVNAAPKIAATIRHDIHEVPTINEFLEKRYDCRREQFLLLEAELENQRIPSIIATPADPMRLGTIVENLFGCDEINNIKSLCINAKGKTTTLKNAEDIVNFNIVPTVYDVERRKLYHSTILQLQTAFYRYIFYLDAQSQSDFTVYIRLSAMQIPLHVNHNSNASEPKALSCLIAYDKTTRQNQHAEFKYVWQDAQDKVKQGKESELTEVQQLLLRLSDNKPDERLFRASKYFLAKRYFEALTILLPLNKEWQSNYFKMTNKEQSAYLESCYIIGSCYMALHQYDSGIYYLSLLDCTTIDKYLRTYVNALVRAGDLRMLREIQRLMGMIDNIAENNDGERTEEQNDFYEFLYRRLGNGLLHFRELDDAEQVFRKMLSASISVDYAKNKLAEIAVIRQKQETETTSEEKITD